jgi:hypothetical protein
MKLAESHNTESYSGSVSYATCCNPVVSFITPTHLTLYGNHSGFCSSRKDCQAQRIYILLYMIYKEKATSYCKTATAIGYLHSLITRSSHRHNYDLNSNTGLHETYVNIVTIQRAENTLCQTRSTLTIYIYRAHQYNSTKRY